jgi:hypothetical protein
LFAFQFRIIPNFNSRSSSENAVTEEHVAAPAAGEVDAVLVHV